MKNTYNDNIVRVKRTIEISELKQKALVKLERFNSQKICI